MEGVRVRLELGGSFALRTSHFTQSQQYPSRHYAGLSRSITDVAVGRMVSPPAECADRLHFAPSQTNIVPSRLARDFRVLFLTFVDNIA